MSKKQEQNFLDMIPVPSLRIKTVYENGLATLVTPRFSKEWMARFFLFGKKNEVRISLDENGSQVWQVIDGKRNVREILQELSGTKEKEKNYEDRVVLFLQQLTGHGFLTV